MEEYRNKEYSQMTKKEKKLYAQDLIMQQLGTISGYVYDNDNLSEEEQEELMSIITKQGDRIAKLYGFKKMWFG